MGEKHEAGISSAKHNTPGTKAREQNGFRHALSFVFARPLVNKDMLVHNNDVGLLVYGCSSAPASFWFKTKTLHDDGGHVP
jgi:hypothetical protein